MPDEIPDLYKVLSVQRWADQSLIEAQYRRKYEAYVEATQDTEELESAYAILSDPESRGEYDELLFREEADVFDTDHYEEGHWENLPEEHRGDWSIRKIISWVFSAFILMSITSSICENIVN